MNSGDSLRFRGGRGDTYEAELNDAEAKPSGVRDEDVQVPCGDGTETDSGLASTEGETPERDRWQRFGKASCRLGEKAAGCSFTNSRGRRGQGGGSPALGRGVAPHPCSFDNPYEM